jgi:hypothetical protein
MSGARAIQFTQEQARAITGVSSETLRHWRKIVPYLARKSGKAARFTFPDLIGLAVTRQVVETFGVSIGTVHASIEALFRILAEMRPLALQNTVVVIGTKGVAVHRVDEIAGSDFSGPRLMIPCDPLMEKLREYVLSDLVTDPQMNLPFPPQVVRR